MASNTLEIILKAKDQATAEIQRVNAELKSIEKATVEVGKKTEKTGKTIKQQFKEAGVGVRDFRKTMFLATIAMAAMVASVREAARYSEEAKQKFSFFTTAISGLSATVGSALAPALEEVGHIVNLLTTAVEFLVASFIKGFALIVEGAIAIWIGLKNVFDNIKNFFTGNKDPIGIVEGFKQSFDRALENSDIATDEFIRKTEEMRARVTAGQPIPQQNEKLNKAAKQKEEADAKDKKAWKDKIDAANSYGETLGSVGTIMESYAGKNKTLAKAAAAVAMASAIVTGATVILNALATQPFIPLGLAAGIAATAMVAAQVATIAGQSFHSGGLIRAHSGLAIDEVPIIAQTGEGILSRRGMSTLGGAGMLNRLNSGMGGWGQSIHIEINYPSIRSNEDIDTLTEEISRRLARETERL